MINLGLAALCAALAIYGIKTTIRNFQLSEQIDDLNKRISTLRRMYNVNK